MRACLFMHSVCLKTWLCLIHQTQVAERAKELLCKNKALFWTTSQSPEVITEPTSSILPNFILLLSLESPYSRALITYGCFKRALPLCYTRIKTFASLAYFFFPEIVLTVSLARACIMQSVEALSWAVAVLCSISTERAANIWIFKIPLMGFSFKKKEKMGDGLGSCVGTIRTGSEMSGGFKTKG